MSHGPVAALPAISGAKKFPSRHGTTAALARIAPGLEMGFGTMYRTHFKKRDGTTRIEQGRVFKMALSRCASQNARGQGAPTERIATNYEAEAESSLRSF